MKKVVSLFLIMITLVAALFGCGEAANETTADAQTETKAETNAETAETSGEATETSGEATET